MKKVIIITLGKIVAATGLYASQVDSVLVKYGYNPQKIDYRKVQKETISLPDSFGSIETNDATIDTKYEAAIALEWRHEHWIQSVLLLKEMQRVYPDRAEEFSNNINSIKENYNVTEKQIEDAYIAQLKQDFAKNKQLTFYIKGTTQLSPEASIILKYLMASPSERVKYQQAVIDMALDIAKKSLRDGKESPSGVKKKEFNEFMANNRDIQSFVMSEIDKFYDQQH